MLTWKVIMEELDSRKIIFYDLFASGHWEQVARKIKEDSVTREEWEKRFRLRLQSQYWARCEYEVVVTSWPPYIKVGDIQKLQDEVADREKAWGSKPLKVNITPTVQRKIDIFEQLDMNWSVFADYVWNNI